MIRTVLTMVLAVLMSVSCGTTNSKESSLEGNSSLEGEFYTQHNMWTYHGVVYPTNFSVSVKIPVNTKIVIDSVKKNKIFFHLVNQAGSVIQLLNIQAYTGLETKPLIERTFSREPLDLSRFTDTERQFIKEFSGFYCSGISKEALLVARGYPPVHKTPSVSMDTWIYWRNKWKSLRISFADNKTISRNDRPLQPCPDKSVEKEQ